MRPLTLDRPKPMVEVLGKPLLRYIFESLPDSIDEVIIVVGYKREAIIEYFGENFLGRKITYVVQEEKRGTGHALGLTKNFLNDSERFLLLNADDIYSRESIARCMKHPLALLVIEVEDPRRYGVAELDGEGILRSLIEKPEQPLSNTVATGIYVLDTRIFDYSADLHPNGEYYITTMLSKMLKDHDMYAESTERGLAFASADDIAIAEQLIKNGEIDFLSK